MRKNNLTNIIKSAKWCELHCGKCRNLTRKKIEKLDNLQNELEAINLTDIATRYSAECVYTMEVIVKFFGEYLDWDVIVNNWLEKYSCDRDDLSSIFQSIEDHCGKTIKDNLLDILH
jgi:predicted metal-binding protein